MAESKNMRDTIIKVLRAKYHEALKNKTDENKFAVAMVDFPLDFSVIRKHIEKNKKTKPSPKSFFPIDLEPVKDDILPNVILNHSYDSVKKTLNFQSQSGIFKLSFSNGEFLFFAQRLVGLGKNANIDSYGVGSRNSLNNYFKFLHAEAKLNSKPKVGLFKINIVNGFGKKILQYTEIKKKDFKTNIVFHQSQKLIENDVSQFFDNIHLYTRFSQPGSRRMLLVGEPGGGKTSAAMLLAQEYSKKMCVVIATDLESLMMHTYNISKAKMQTLAILEDAESTIPWGDSGVLNYLDGINQPKTEKGCYVILTTNFPKRIEPRVLKRPGRLDKVIKFGALDEQNSMECVKHYFEGILFEKKDKPNKIEEILKQVYEEIILDTKNGGSLTGAQIKNLSEATIAHAISNKIDKITVSVLKEVVERLNKDLKEVYDMADVESMSNDKMTPVGFELETNRRSGGKIDWDSIINPKTKQNNELSW